MAVLLAYLRDLVEFVDMWVGRISVPPVLSKAEIWRFHVVNQVLTLYSRY